MFKTVRLFTILLSLVILSGCSSLSWLKFWGDDEEEIELPAVLEEITQKLTISSLWDAKVGKEKIQGRIFPSISGERLFYINAEGELFAFDKNNGRKIWEKETDDQASGGIETAFRKIIYGTLDGEVVVLNQENGEETWRAQATSEILSSPITNGSVVIAQGADGSVTGFDFNNGEQSWIHQVTVPNLSLRGTSAPILKQGFIFTGFANGSVAMIYPDSGAVRLELPITINEAASELERIVDIDGKVVVSSDVLVSASYQGLRGLTSPVSVRGNIAVGDFEGYIHLINGGDGSFLGRFRASKNPIVEIVSEGDKLAITDDKGRLFFLSLS